MTTLIHESDLISAQRHVAKAALNILALVPKTVVFVMIAPDGDARYMVVFTPANTPLMSFDDDVFDLMAGELYEVRHGMNPDGILMVALKRKAI